MQRDKTETTQRSPLADLTWKTMDLVFWPLRESARFTRRLLEARDGREGTDDESADFDTDISGDEGSNSSTNDEAPPAPLEHIWGIGAARAPKLRKQGLSSPGDVADADLDTLTALPGVGATTAERIKKSAVDLLERE